MARTVLIVDDSKINRQILKMALKTTYDVLEAENGQVALDILHENFKTISAVLLDVMMPVMDGYETLEHIRNDADLSQISVIILTGSIDESFRTKALSLGASDFLLKPFNPEIIFHCLKNNIALRETTSIVNTMRIDKLTGLYTQDAFFEIAEERIHEHGKGYYTLSCLNIENFKVINDQYGRQKGDLVLKHVANCISESMRTVDGICCRLASDRFALLFPSEFLKTDTFTAAHSKATRPDFLDQPMTIRIGRYTVNDLDMPVSSMYDRASLAEASVKGKFDLYTAEFDESMRDRLVEEQQIVNGMEDALARKEFEPWFQPQYNHADGALIGAEALVRWRKDGKIVPPYKFIPLFEKNGFIYQLDKDIWEQTCACLRKWLDSGIEVLPVSVNISRQDIFHNDIFSIITGLVEKYQLPVELLRLEVTESAFAETTGEIVAVVRRLIDYGFTVEIDDFGSGYSSLNTLKDVPAQILKLDMKFLEDTNDSERGGSIIQSVVRMAKWLNMSIIAEGVETIEQADFLKSIGCNYIQGYFYSKPVPLADYEALLYGTRDKEPELDTLEKVEHFDDGSFWKPESIDSLVFNSYIGGACVFEYVDGREEILRINKSYTQELGIQCPPGEELNIYDAFRYVEPEDGARLRNCIQLALSTTQEQEVELRLSDDGTCFPNPQYVRFSIRLISRISERFLFYVLIKNITAQRLAEQKEKEAQQQNREIAESLSIVAENIGGGLTVFAMNQGKIDYLFVNKRYYRLIGYTEEAFAGISQRDLVHPDDWKRVEEAASKLREDGDPITIQYRIIKQDKSLAWIQATISMCRFPFTETPVELAIYSDISAQKTAEENAGKSRSRLQFLNDCAHSVLAQPDSGRAVTHVLSSLQRFFDADSAFIVEVENQDPGSGILDKPLPAFRLSYEVWKDDTPSGRYSHLEFIKRIDPDSEWYGSMQNGNHYPATDTSKIKDRKISTWLTGAGIHASLGAPLMRDGKMTGFVGIDNPRREMEDLEHLHALADYISILLTRRDLTAKLRSSDTELLDNLPFGAALFQFNGKDFQVLHLNRQYWKLVGRAPDNPEEISVMNAVHPDDKATLFQEVQLAISENRNAEVDTRILCGNGQYRQFHITARIIRQDAGTADSRAESKADSQYLLYAAYTPKETDSLSYQQMLPIVLSAIMSASTDMTYVKDSQLRYISASLSTSQAAGFADEKQIIGKTDYDILPPEVAGRYTEDDRQVFTTGRPILNKLDIIPASDSSHPIRYAITSKYPLLDAEGHVIGIYGTGRDVTRQKEQESQLRLLSDSIPGGIASFRYDRKGLREEYYSNGFYLFSGYNREEFQEITAGNPLNLIHPEDRPKIQDILQQQIQTRDENQIWECDIRCMTKTLGYRWFTFKARISNLTETGFSINSVLFEIQRTKELEQNLRVSGEEYRLATRLSHLVVSRYHVGNSTLTISQETASTYSLQELTEDVPDSPIRRREISPDTAGAYKDFFQRIRRGEETGKAVFQKLIRGRWRWLEANFATIFDNAGEPIEAVIAYSDITSEREGRKTGEFERNALFNTISSIYPTVFITNLTRNYYYTINTSSSSKTILSDSGDYDALTAAAIKFICPEYQEVFIRTFSLENLLAAHQRGEKSLRLEYRQFDPKPDPKPNSKADSEPNSKPDSKPDLQAEAHWSETVVFFADNPYDSDVLEINLSRNIDAQKENEEKLQSVLDITTDRLTSRLHYGELINKVGSGFILVHHLGKDQPDFYVGNLLTIFGYNKEEVENYKNLSQLVHPDDAANVNALFQKATQTIPKTYAYEFRIRRKNGTYAWVTNTSTRFEDQNGTGYVSVYMDNTQQHELRDRLRQSEEENRLALMNSGSYVGRFYISDRTLTLEAKTAARIGLPKKFINAPYEQIDQGLVSPESQKTYITFHEDIINGHPSGAAIFQFKFAKGWRWIEAHYSTVYAEDSTPVSAVISFHDVTEQVKKETIYKQWKQGLDEKDPKTYALYTCNISNEDAKVTLDGGTLINPTHDLSRINPKQALDFAVSHACPEDRQTFATFLDFDRLLADYYRGRRQETLEYRIIEPDSSLRWRALTINLVEIPNGTDVEAHFMFEDINDAKQAELLTLAKAQTDPLTGLLNRETFSSRTNTLLQPPLPETAPAPLHALLMLDIDNFKLVNDFFGHGAGDQTLIDVAEAIKTSLRHQDIVGRLGGDEFVAFLTDITDPSVATEKASAICALIHKYFNAEVEISASIGIAISPRDGTTFDQLYKNADTALYRVKSSGKNNFALYQPDMPSDHPETLPDRTAVDTPASPASSSAQNPKTSAGPKRRMLVVDDDKLEHALMARLFSDDFIVEKATDGGHALGLLRHSGSATSIVLLDLMMPGLDGFAVLKKMQENAELRHIPVIVVSGAEDQETCIRAIRAGAADFVTKPFDPDLLRLRINTAISKAENERLRAQNSILAYQNLETTKKLRSLLDHKK